MNAKIMNQRIQRIRNLFLDGQLYLTPSGRYASYKMTLDLLDAHDKDVTYVSISSSLLRRDIQSAMMIEQVEQLEREDFING